VRPRDPVQVEPGPGSLALTGSSALTLGRGLQSEDAVVVFARSCGSVCNKQPLHTPPLPHEPLLPAPTPHQSLPLVLIWSKTRMMMIMLFILLLRNKLRIPLEGTYS